MSNKELIAQMREAIDNMDDFARMSNVVATGPLLVLSKAADALEAADKRIAELEQTNCSRLDEAERKLAVAREALSAMWLHYKSLVDSGDAGNWTPEDEPVCKQAVEALAQIGGDDACRVSSAYSGPSNCNRGTVGCINPAHRVWKGAEGGNDAG